MVNRSMIYIQYASGSKPKGVRVVLSFTMGLTKPVYTDRNGVAIVEHQSKGKATVFVSGKKQGSFRAPGRYVVTL